MWNNFASGITGERGAEGFGESFGTLLLVAAPVAKRLPIAFTAAGRADLASAKAASASAALSYASRIRVRSIEGGAAHRFPYSFDQIIIANGSRTIGKGGYVQYVYPGVKNGYSGNYEISGYFQKGKFSVTSRLFRPGK